MTIEAVVFDWGGTLTPWHDIDLFAQWYAYAEIYDPPRAAALAQQLLDAETYRWQLQRESGGATSTGALDSIFINLGINTGSAAHFSALSNYLDFWAPHTLADPQAGELLRQLRSTGLAIGVLSNTLWPRAHHQEVFERDNLAQLIDAACYTSEMEVAKPHRESFLSIASRLDVAPEQCVFVGDRIWDDIYGAQQVGMRAIWIPHSKVPSEQIPAGDAVPDAIAHELIEVSDIVRRWLLV
ncbi:hypothetical protein LBMAG15_02460 [Actinomycetes bacterium]|nr:hypothetical protein LBMAG15_02460 [Actinomycetes bacterium]